VSGKSYSASRVRVNKEMIRKYIKSQAEEDKGQAELYF
jgi:hypothetical protein